MADIRSLSFDDIPGDAFPKQTRQADIRALSFADIPSQPLTGLQAGGAVASGVNRGVIAGLGGLPVKTALDVADLARAAYGYVGGKTGLLAPDQLPEPLDRAKYVGSPEWIDAQMQRTPYTAAAINNPRPDSPTARVLNSGGFAVGSSLAGTPGQMGMQFASGTMGQGAAEMGASPATAMLLSMTPQAAVTTSQAAVRGAVRGGDQGRRDMEQRIQDFKNAGVDPTVGLATGGRLPQAIESTLSRMPGGAGAMADAADTIRSQLQGTVNTARDNVSPIYGPEAAGTALKRGAEQYRQQQQDIYSRMLDNALAKVPPGMTFPAPNMVQRGQQSLADIPGAPNVSNVINQPRQFTAGLLSALDKDAQPQPPRQAPTGLLDASGQPLSRDVPGTPGGLPITGLLDLRSRIGELAYQNNPLNADANTGALKNLYGGAKADIQNAGVLADAERIAQGQQPGVSAGLSRADRFYTQTQDILDNVLAPIHRAAEAAPEKGYARFDSEMRNAGANVQKTMAALPLDVRRQVAATAIDQLGKATPGQQNAAGDAFSPATFLSNWNRLPDNAKTGVLFGIPNGNAVRDKLDYVAKAVERMNSASKVFANPSGTAGAAATLGSMASAGGGLALLATGHPTAGASALTGVLGTAAVARLGSWGMTNPRVVNWLAQTTALKPEQMQTHLNRLGLMAAQEKDPETRANLEAFAQGLRDELGY